MRIEEHARLEITLPDGKKFDVAETDILADSLSISARCVNGNTFAFGCVSPAQLSVRFRIRGSNINRYDMYGAVIVLYSWFGETPPEDGGKRGVFNVTGVTKKQDMFTVSASDNVILLDTAAFGADGSSGEMGNRVYNRLHGSLWCAIDVMGIIIPEMTDSLTFNHKGLDKSIIPNAVPEFTGFDAGEPEGGYDIRLVILLDDEQSDNLRDYVAWLAEYMGGFVCADNDGSIQFRLFQTKRYVPSPKTLRYAEFQEESLEIAGFRIQLNRNGIVTEDNHFCSIIYPAQSGEQGECVIQEEIVEKQNPFVEGIYLYKNDINEMRHIAGALANYHNRIQIRPFSGIWHGTEYLSLGQYIRILDEDGTECDTVITNIEWRFRGGQKIGCIGEDSRTLSEARKRTQAIRTGERLKTQLHRLEDRLTQNSSQVGNDIASLGGRIDTLERQNLDSRITTLERQKLDGRINDLAARVQALENGG